MSTIRIHEIAFEDLKRLREFLLPVNRAVSSRAISTIREYINKLKTSVHLGSPYGDFKRLIIPFGRSTYIVYYYYDPHADVVHVMRIVHGRENFDLSDQTLP